MANFGNSKTATTFLVVLCQWRTLPCPVVHECYDITMDDFNSLMFSNFSCGSCVGTRNTFVRKKNDTTTLPRMRRKGTKKAIGQRC